MATTQIRGKTQIQDGTINAAKLEASFNLPTIQLQDGALLLKKDGTVALTADLPLGGNKIVNLATPIAATDAANKAYVDSMAAGLDTKASVKILSTTNLSLTGLQTIDGYTIVAGDRVLLTGQTAAAQNGIWIAGAGAWTRPTDYPAASSTAVTPSAFVFVEQGVTYGDTGWTISTDAAITVDTTPTVWTQFSGAGSIVAGAGLTKTGNSIDIGTGNGIAVAADSISVLADPAGNISVGAAGVKMAPGTPGQVVITNAGGTQVGSVSLSGDATVSAVGVVTVANQVKLSKIQLRPVALTGTVDAVNKVFTIPVAIVAGTEAVYLNGLLLNPVTDYTIAASTVTLAAGMSAPSNAGGQTDWLAAQYVAA